MMTKNQLSITELELGKIIQKSGWKRTSYIITTKIYWSMKSEERGLSRKHIIESVKASLQRLQLPYIDVVIIYKADSMCPMEGKSFICFPIMSIFFFIRVRCDTHATMQRCGPWWCFLLFKFVLYTVDGMYMEMEWCDSVFSVALREIRVQFTDLNKRPFIYYLDP